MAALREPLYPAAVAAQDETFPLPRAIFSSGPALWWGLFYGVAVGGADLAIFATARNGAEN